MPPMQITRVSSGNNELSEEIDILHENGIEDNDSSKLTNNLPTSDSVSHHRYRSWMDVFQASIKIKFSPLVSITECSIGIAWRHRYSKQFNIANPKSIRKANHRHRDHSKQQSRSARLARRTRYHHAIRTNCATDHKQSCQQQQFERQ